MQAIAKRFAEHLAPLTIWDVQEQVRTWAGVIIIAVACWDETWQRMRREPLTSRLLVDTLSEAVTNAVRHGALADIAVTIDTNEAEGRVRLTVQSQGTLTNGIRNGTGRARLIERGAQIALDQVDVRVVEQALL